MYVILGLLGIGLYILCKEIGDWLDSRLTPEQRAAVARRDAKYLEGKSFEAEVNDDE